MDRTTELYHRLEHTAWRDEAERLLALKQTHGTTISLVLPAKNEEATVGDVVRTFLPTLHEEIPLLDEIVVMDSLSTDATARVAVEAGARCVGAQEAVPDVEARPGKGETMWRSLFATGGDLVVFVDADLKGIGPHYVTGLLAPLLDRPETMLVKGFYERPLTQGATVIRGGGGRVTELCIRPLLNLYWPELAFVIQPLAGETAARRSLLQQLPFPHGYGIETSLLLDTATRYGVEAITQVDLGYREHSHQDTAALGRMAAQVTATALRRLDREPTNYTLRQYELTEDAILGHDHEINLAERRPANSYRAYHEAVARNRAALEKGDR